MRSQKFRQIVQRRRRNTDVFQGVYVQDGEIYASSWRTKALAGLRAVLPLHLSYDLDFNKYVLGKLLCGNAGARGLRCEIFCVHLVERRKISHVL